MIKVSQSISSNKYKRAILHCVYKIQMTARLNTVTVTVMVCVQGDHSPLSPRGSQQQDNRECICPQIHGIMFTNVYQS